VIEHCLCPLEILVSGTAMLETRVPVEHLPWYYQRTLLEIVLLTIITVPALLRLVCLETVAAWEGHTYMSYSLIRAL
jgi:hypothetical protein